MDCDLTGILNRTFRRKPKQPLASNEAVVTVADVGTFIGFQLLYASLMMRHECNVVLYDLGLDPRQKRWCLRQPNIIHIIPEHTPLFILQGIGDDRWNKPYFLYCSPFERSLWMDPETIVLNDLNQLFCMLDHGPFILNGKEEISPDNLFFTRMPMGIKTPEAANYPVTTVMGIDKCRDFYLLRDWIYGTRCVMENEKIRAIARHFDANVLGWALTKNQMTHVTTENVIWCWPSQTHRSPMEPLVYESAEELLASVKIDFPLAHIVSWESPRPWLLWENSVCLRIDPHY